MAPRRKKPRLSKSEANADNSNALDNGRHDAAKLTSETEEPQTQGTSSRQSLFVRSLAASTSTEDLEKHFSQSYPLKHAVAVLDPVTKQCKGYGFVTFSEAADAHRAKSELDGSLLHGRKIKLDIAKPRHRDRDGSAPPEEGKQGSASRGVSDQVLRKRDENAANEPPKLIIRNLPWSIKEPEQLGTLFRSYGKVKYVTIPTKRPGLMAGFGFVVMRGRKNAEKALEAVNGKEIDGRVLAVDWAVEQDAWQALRKPSKEDESAPPSVSADDDEEHLMLVNKPSNGQADDDEDDEDNEDDGRDDGIDDESNAESAGEDEAAGTDGLGTDARTDPDGSVTESTLFVRNLPFSCSDETVLEHFSQFGPVRYARIVMDHETARPKGTGFVCFYDVETATACLKGVPKRAKEGPTQGKPASAPSNAHSILQDDYADPTGRYTLDGRVLQVSRAVNKSQAANLTAQGVQQRAIRDRDKRRLFLLSEGTIPSNSALYEQLAPSEKAMREASVKQRRMLIESNPSLHLSFTRLSVRNIPRSVTSKDLKTLAREAVVGFAKDVKEGKRQRLSREELGRGGDEMKRAEHDRKVRGKGIVKQAKVVFEGRSGEKITEGNGAGRSRGYGFIEYYTHRSALMGLRWLNGHALDRSKMEGKKGKLSKEESLDRKKRLIVEFAIENAQVVLRRKEREEKVREKPKHGAQRDELVINGSSTLTRRTDTKTTPRASHKRKRGAEEDAPSRKPNDNDRSSKEAPTEVEKEKLAKRQKIIARKRMIRRSRKTPQKVSK